MIEVRNVTKAYGGATVVADVSLHLPAPGLTAIVGPNGAGKTTLLSIMARLSAADSGSVRIGGMDVATARSDLLARRLAILRQDNVMTARLTVGELVGFGRYPHNGGRPTQMDRDRIAASIAFLDLEGLEHRFLDELSGGQRQRAFMAMVLCQDTDYLLLDEPLNGLDMRHAVETMRLLRRAVDDLGKAVVVVLHDINAAAAYADRVVAMKSGRVVFHGTARDFMSDRILCGIYDMEIAVHEIGDRRVAVLDR
ncbi:ABC transporter ATP-binding protein [Aquibium microcysteis]|uniref:iron ABC transporter ATP-binding protein n=1 Tax=Aquibium microcysteis TaxID=675281 RepID=UPI00165CF4C8|nr:ATP-binding cassette domain-containing protein [Aquibium microcysteis]